MQYRVGNPKIRIGIRPGILSFNFVHFWLVKSGYKSPVVLSLSYFLHGVIYWEDKLLSCIVLVISRFRKKNCNIFENCLLLTTFVHLAGRKRLAGFIQCLLLYLIFIGSLSTGAIVGIALLSIVLAAGAVIGTVFAARRFGYISM